MYANDMSLSLKSDTFSALKEDFDSILARTIGNMEMKGAEEATAAAAAESEFGESIDPDVPEAVETAARDESQE